MLLINDVFVDLESSDSDEWKWGESTHGDSDTIGLKYEARSLLFKGMLYDKSSHQKMSFQQWH